MARTVTRPEIGLNPLAQSLADFGHLIRNRRACSGLALMDAADQLGVSKSALSRLENGRAVGLDLALRVASGLGLQLLIVDKAQAADALDAIRPAAAEAE
ncbi:helix-turn-helix domain-containing protein [Robbsia sp. KACC 23696]|uniref:helix-turn-helix domain-containing protein n=1 Tax=Robbsia sp. KACC 23696 TaxID=3149231 RepID=UPI00325A8163